MMDIFLPGNKHHYMEDKIMRKICSRFLYAVLCSILIFGCMGTKAMGEQDTHTFTEGYFKNCSFEIRTLHGFSFPQLLSYEFHSYDEGSSADDYYWSSFIKEYSQSSIALVNRFVMEDEDALEEYKRVYNQEELLDEEIIQIDGHMAYLSIKRWTRPNDKQVLLEGHILYYRNNYWFEMDLFSPRTEKKDWDKIPKITIKDLKEFAKYISYDESSSTITAKSGSFSVKAKDNQTILSAGKSLPLSTEYDNPNCIQEFDSAHSHFWMGYGYKKNQQDEFTWSVIDLDTGNESKDVTIDKNNTIIANKRIDRILNIEIRAKSKRFTSTASYHLTVIPVVKAITTDPKEIVFYEGTNNSATAKVILEPSSVPLSGITWTATNAHIINIESNENDGTAVITPIKAGKTAITVKEPGGKSTKLTVTVVVPVETVELTVKGTVKAGSKVNIIANLVPKKVGNKTVQWSLDVGEDIATINNKGQLIINKSAPSGTKITVTCTALGAPSPITGTIIIEVP